MGRLGLVSLIVVSLAAGVSGAMGGAEQPRFQSRQIQIGSDRYQIWGASFARSAGRARRHALVFGDARAFVNGFPELAHYDGEFWFEEQGNKVSVPEGVAHLSPDLVLTPVSHRRIPDIDESEEIVTLILDYLER